MISTCQSLPVAANLYQSLPVGLDVGNGSTKMVIKGDERRILSYVLPLHRDVYDTQIGTVEYLDGSRSDLIGQSWMTGKGAYLQSPKSYLKVSHDRDGKIIYGLHLLLGAIANFPHQPDWNLQLIASIQDAKAFGDELKFSLSGQHSVRLNGKNLTTVTVDVLSVVEEGFGAVASASHEFDRTGQSVVFDFGAGTCIVSHFQGVKLIGREYTDGGVESLINAIATSIETRKYVRSQGDANLIRAGIEDKTFNYGATGWNFRGIYQAELKPWVLSVLAPALKIAQPWMASASTKLAIGGGAQLPQIGSLLAAKGITPLTDSHWVNARGLASLAALKAKGSS